MRTYLALKDFMAIFLVIPSTEATDGIKASIEAQTSADAIKFFELPRGEFFVSFKGTSTELSNLLKITPIDGSEIAPCIVISVGTYYGRATSTVWEWVQAHAE
jgi:hypothetical protein